MIKIITKKHKGISDLISSLIVIIAMIMLLFMCLGFVRDVQTITSVDQIARQAIIQVETKGYLNNASLTSLKNDLINSCGVEFTGSKSINGVTVNDGVYMIYEDAGSGLWKIETSNNIDSLTDDIKRARYGYGKVVGIYIQCEMYGTGIDSNGRIGKNSKTQICRLKSSISKTL